MVAERQSDNRVGSGTMFASLVVGTEDRTMGGNPQDIKAVWKEKWMQAKTSLEFAIVRFSEIQRVANVPQNDYQRSLKTLTAAVNDYTRVSQIYTLLIGPLPDG